MQNLNIAVNDRVWPDFDVGQMSNWGMGYRVLRDAESCIPPAGTHKSWSRLLKIPKAESAGRMFFSRGTTTYYDWIIWLKSEVRHVLFVPSVAS